MKKTIFILFATAGINFYVNAQSAGLVANRYRSLINTGQSGWNEKINSSLTINKTKMKKTIFMATLISAAMTVNAQTANKDEQAVTKIISTLETGWNNKSGEIFASVFADVHDYIVINGYYFPGFTRAGNAAQHQFLFDGIYKTSNIKLKVDKISFIRPDLAMIHVLGAGYHKDSTVPANPAIIMTVLAEKKSDSWKIISFHNHSMESFANKDRSPVPLNVMYASWYKN